MNASDCDFGCTGPTSAHGSAPLDPAWDSAEGWFAINDPATGQGVVVNRVPSSHPQDKPISAQLWIDWDAGPPITNPSSFLLLSPTNGFSGGLVTEVETLCFYNSAIWTPSVVPPVGCRNGLIALSPWILNFVGQLVGTTSLPQNATLTNLEPTRSQLWISSPAAISLRPTTAQRCSPPKRRVRSRCLSTLLPLEYEAGR